MKFCPQCSASNGNEYGRCHRCGFSLTREPRLKGAAEFDNPGVTVNREIHRRHRWLNLRISCAVSAVVQVLVAASLGMVQDWTLGVQAVVAVGMAVLVHKLRWGYLRIAVLGMLLAGLTFLATGHMQGMQAIFAFFAIWVLGFWYGLLGHQVQLNNEVHQK